MPIVWSCGHAGVVRLNDLQRKQKPICPDCSWRAGQIGHVSNGRESFLSLTESLGLTVLSEYVSASERVSLIGTCGHPFEASPNKLQRKKNGLCSRCAKHPTGEDHPRWNPDLTEEDRLSGWYGRGGPFHSWSEEVLRSADWTCDITGERGIELEAHHLSGWAGNPEKRFELQNGVAIAKDLHTLFHSRFYFGKVDNTPEQYAAFKEMIWAS